MVNLKNQTVFITGTTSGIGRDIALRFARDDGSPFPAGARRESQAGDHGRLGLCDRGARQQQRYLTGQFFIDEDVLRGQGIADFEQYALTPGAKLYTDIFFD